MGTSSPIFPPMTDNNLRYWAELSKTDPKHTQKFDRGRFKGTAIRPIYSELRMTEQFGPCGIGWGMEKPEFQIQAVNNEVVVYCTLAVWYMDGETRGMVYGIGGDKVLAQQKNGPFVSDEAFKAAFTDALTNAFKHLGVSADVHMGRFDDHKYVAAMQREFADDAPAQAAPMHPESPPEYDLARTDYQRLLHELRDAVTTEAIEHPARGIWARNTDAVARIKEHGGQSAVDALHAIAQTRLDELRQGEAA